MGLGPGTRKTKIPLVPGPVPSSKFRLSQEERLSRSLASQAGLAAPPLLPRACCVASGKWHHLPEPVSSLIKQGR